jgi:hypothetical protein
MIANPEGEPTMPDVLRQLRDEARLARGIGATYGALPVETIDRAADAIEARDRRIAEMEADLQSAKGSLSMLRLGIDEACQMAEDKRKARAQPP